MRISEMGREQAESAIEQLRFGIPPSNVSHDFTVGRGSQIKELGQSLEHAEKCRALLIRANYGAGKSHLLRVLREIALDKGFVVAFIVADAQGGVRFNRMDTVFGAICRDIEVPGHSEKGIGALFDAYRQPAKSMLDQGAKAERRKISSKNKWDFSDLLKAPGIYVALRAWFHDRDDPIVRDCITGWLSSPENYRGQRKFLYDKLVQRLRGDFLDKRPEWQFYADEVFLFHTGGHRQSWDALEDLHRLARCSGYRGFVLLVDEFEDVIQNLPYRNHKQMAFYNLFRFFAGERFPGQAYFAVTPDFAQKCKKELLNKGVYDFDYEAFDDLPFFELDPIEVDDVFLLAKGIRQVHDRAYGWDAEKILSDSFLRRYCEQVMAVDIPDKIRRAIISIVALLDEKLDAG